jgi:hypothetical protein
MSVNESLTRDIEGRLIDWEVAMRDMDRDGVRTPAELAAMVELADRALAQTSKLTRTVGHIQNCLSGADGMFSYRARRGWDESQRLRTEELEPLSAA